MKRLDTEKGKILKNNQIIDEGYIKRNVKRKTAIREELADIAKKEGVESLAYKNKEKTAESSK